MVDFLPPPQSENVSMACCGLIRNCRCGLRTSSIVAKHRNRSSDRNQKSCAATFAVDTRSLPSQNVEKTTCQVKCLVPCYSSGQKTLATALDAQGSENLDRFDAGDLKLRGPYGQLSQLRGSYYARKQTMSLYLGVWVFRGLGALVFRCLGAWGLWCLGVLGFWA